jgi:hypothetical protein
MLPLTKPVMGIETIILVLGVVVGVGAFVILKGRSKTPPKG